MKIAVNTRFLLKDRLEGIGWFTYETLKRITRDHPEHDFFFIFDRPYDDSFIFNNNVHPIVVGPQARHPILWYWWFERTLPDVLRRLKPDVFLSTDGFGVLLTEVPTALVIHDLAFEHFENHHSWLVKSYLRKISPLYARKAARIVTVSEYSKQDICQQYGIDADKIDVAYNGMNVAFQPVDENTKRVTRQQYAHGEEYFVYAGSIHPRKNVERLLLAFDQFKTKTGARTKLVLAGAKGWKTGKAWQTLNSLKHKDDVVLTGHLTADKLVPVIASASAMLYVSLFEGFGIPILEAMCCGVPVITSNVSSMPEVADGAALTVDPESVADIASAMQKLQEDPALRDQLVEKGLQRASQFSWDHTAAQLWLSLEQLISR